MNKKFRIRDKVRIIKNWMGAEEYYFHKGDIVEIIRDCGNGEFQCRRKDCINHNVPIDCIEPLNNTKVIFNGNITILLKNGLRYVSKCEDGDAYDREKGLLLCLAKANGISYQGLQEMLANAKMHTDGIKKCRGNKKCKKE